MPSSLSFKNEKEIINALKMNGKRWEHNLRKDHKNQKELGPLIAIYGSITASTYRAFRKRGDYTPSTVFRAWAAEEIATSALSEFRNISSNEDYRIWAKRVARSLRKRWKKQLWDLDMPRALKLVNLLAKGLCAVSPLWPKESRLIVNHIDVPLDKYSLQPLACIDELHKMKLHRASMGSIKTVDDYDKVQDVIRKLCDKAKIPTIAYDFLVWNGPHVKKH
jgi:hypothetical protein